MSQVRRIYVEKKEAFAGKARGLHSEIKNYLGINEVTGVRVMIRYDVENISDEIFEAACNCVFSEPPVDILYKERVSRLLIMRKYSVWNIFRDSLTREQTLQFSV